MLQGTGLAHVEKNNVGRDFAVGDIHGAFTALNRAMDAIGFDRERDRLFSVGDLVDRGPESHRVLDWLDQSWFRAICGKHDFMAGQTAIGTPYAQVDHLKHGGAWLELLSDADRMTIGMRLSALPLAMEIGTSRGPVGLVHADCPYDDWQDMRRFDWDAASCTDPVPSCCLWSAERYTRRYAGHIKDVRAVVHGHMVVPVIQTLGNVFFIDTGGWHPGAGHFTFLDLDSLKAIAAPHFVSTNFGRKNR